MGKRKEKVLLVLYFMLVAIAGVFFHFSYLLSTLLFFIPLSVYATVRNPGLFKSLVIYALSIGIPFVLLVDTIGLRNNAWWETSIFSQRIFGLVPFDTIIWGILYAYAIPVLYEYFFGGRQAIVLPKKFWKFTAVLITALAVFLVTFSMNRDWFVVPYFYAVFVGIFYVLNSLIGLIRKPALFSRLLKQCAYFSILLLIGELGALAAHQWGFSGSQYLSTISIWHLSMPLEEMIWILIGVPSYIYVYRELTTPPEIRTKQEIHI